VASHNIAIIRDPLSVRDLSRHSEAQPGGGHARARALVCEQDALLVSSLRHAFAGEPMIEVVGETKSWEEFLRYADEYVPEIMVLSSGVLTPDRARYLRDYYADVCLLVLGEYGEIRADAMIRRIELPADEDALHAAFEWAFNQIVMVKVFSVSQLIAKYVAGAQSWTTYEQVLRMNDGEEQLAIETGSIESVVAQGKYVSIHTADRDYCVRETLQNIASRLDPAWFIRIHRSIVVGTKFVQHIVRRKGQAIAVQMAGTTVFPVGRNFRDLVLDRRIDPTAA